MDNIVHVGSTPTSSTNTNKDYNMAMKFEHERDNIVIDSFILKAAESNVAGIVINYCPICGTKLEINHD